jgi:hypothetical protein
MNFPSLVRGRAWLQQTRCQWLLLMTLLCLGLRENYPFSNFPMYSSFSSRTYYIYLTDAKGAALRTKQFGLSSSGLKKIFDGYRRRELKNFANSGRERVPLAEEAAAQSLVRYLDGLAAARPQAKKLLTGLQVHHISLRQDAHDLVLEKRTMATHE